MPFPLERRLPHIHLHIPHTYTGGIYSMLTQPCPKEQAEGKENWVQGLSDKQEIVKAPVFYLFAHFFPLFYLPFPFERIAFWRSLLNFLSTQHLITV